jgi:peptidylprolyl isomerase
MFKKLPLVLYFFIIFFNINYCFSETSDVSDIINAKSEDSDVIELKITNGATETGAVYIQLLSDIAPKHCQRIKVLTKSGFYDNVPFHRVIQNFMAQTGDPTGTGTGGSGVNIPAEFNETKHVRGIVSMARSSNPDSADSQFFVMYKNAPHLDGQYTAFGKILSGMKYLDKLKQGDPLKNGFVVNPDRIITARVLTKAELRDLNVVQDY